MRPGKTINIVLGGGGIKGLAYIGMTEAATLKKMRFGNIAGVSAGALAGSFIAAGFDAKEMRRIMDEFDFGEIEVENIHNKVPVINRYLDYINNNKQNTAIGTSRKNFINEFMSLQHFEDRSKKGIENFEFDSARGNFFKNITILSKEGCLFEGDLIEQWVSRVLLRKGIRTFGDLRGGIASKDNPRGYRLRVTAVDATRGRVIVLPDDITFYGIDPDRLEVAKAVRMSISIPFAFRPVELKKVEGNKVKTYHIVDGGVLDNLPLWVCDNSPGVTTVGFRFRGKKEKHILSAATPLNILKAIITSIHDTGIPKNQDKNKYIVNIDTTKVPALNFSLSEEEKAYLCAAGRQDSLAFFNRFIRGGGRVERSFFELICRRLRR